MINSRIPTPSCLVLALLSFSDPLLGATPPALQPGAPVDYAPLAFQPETWKEKATSTLLLPWTGTNVVFLTTNGLYDPALMARWVQRLDQGWALYADLTGATPDPFKQWNGRVTIAAVPGFEYTCGAGCGYLGATGIELAMFYEWNYPALVRNSAAMPHYVFYEMGRNYLTFGDRLSAFATGYAVFMRYVCMDTLGCEDEDAETRRIIESVEPLIRTNGLPFFKCFTNLDGLDEKAPRLQDAEGHWVQPSDQPVTYASAMLRLHRELGGNEWLRRFYRALAECAPGKPDTLDGARQQSWNWLVAASVAARRDLGPIFVDDWRLPLTPETRARFSALDWAGGRVSVSTVGEQVKPAWREAPVELSVAGDWTVRVALRDRARPVDHLLQVPPNALVTVTAEKHDTLPRFNPNAGGWVKGAQLRGVRAQETTTPFLLDPASLVLRTGPESTAAVLEPGADYDVDLNWGTIGRTEAGRLRDGQPVFASYRYAPLRLDAIVLTREGRLELRPGEPRAAAPALPALASGERHLGSVWLPGRLTKLAPEHLFPVLETAFPEPPKPDPTIAEQRLPGTMARLRAGQSLRILAWGDSVTDGGYLPDPARERWQEQFAARLRERFPKATIELVSEAWGGRNTDSYLAEPPGSPRNYREKVLGAKPDLIVSEFVNDAGLNPEQVEERYGKLLADFRGLGAEWIILTPHYVRPDWMGLDRERDIDDDPRPYVAGLRQFAAKHDVALADAARRYGRLWRQGIPYTAVMLNSINHPDARGMKIFADALMELFP